MELNHKLFHQSTFQKDKQKELIHTFVCLNQCLLQKVLIIQLMTFLLTIIGCLIDSFPSFTMRIICNLTEILVSLVLYLLCKYWRKSFSVYSNVILLVTSFIAQGNFGTDIHENEEVEQTIKFIGFAFLIGGSFTYKFILEMICFVACMIFHFLRRYDGTSSINDRVDFCYYHLMLIIYFGLLSHSKNSYKKQSFEKTYQNDYSREILKIIEKTSKIGFLIMQNEQICYYNESLLHLINPSEITLQRNDTSKDTISNFLKRLKFQNDDRKSEDVGWWDCYIDYSQLNSRKTDSQFTEEKYYFKDSFKTYSTIFYSLKIRKDFGVLAVITDATKEREENLEEIQRQKKVKMEFLSSISHELKTPVHTMSTVLTSLKETEAQSEKLQQIKMACDSMSLLENYINNILAYTEIETFQFQLNYENVSIYQIINEAKEIFLHQIQAKKIELKISIQKEVPENIFIDKVRLKQVLINLLANCVKYTFSGFIKIKVSILQNPLQLNPDEDSRSLYSMKKEYIQIEVMDTGIGMKKIELAQLFELASVKKIDLGKTHSGLKLAATKLIIKLMRGKIVATSIPKQGSTFLIVLPINDPRFIPRDTNLSKANSWNFSSKFSLKQLDITPKMAERFSFNSKKSYFYSNRSQSKKPLTPHNVSDKKIDSRISQLSKGVLMRNIKEVQEEEKIKGSEANSISNRSLNCSIFSEKKGLLQHFETEANPNRGLVYTNVEIRSHYDDIDLNLLGVPNNIETVSSSSTSSEEIPIENQGCSCPEILVVDDNTFNLYVMESMLAQFGIKIDKAHHGKEALEKIVHRNYNICCPTYKLIFLDLNMPIMDGFECSQAINQKIKNKEIGETIIIAHSANLCKSQLHKCKQYGMKDSLQKPLTRDCLASILNKYNIT